LVVCFRSLKNVTKTEYFELRRRVIFKDFKAREWIKSNTKEVTRSHKFSGEPSFSCWLRPDFVLSNYPTYMKCFSLCRWWSMCPAPSHTATVQTSTKSSTTHPSLVTKFLIWSKAWTIILWLQSLPCEFGAEWLLSWIRRFIVLKISYISNASVWTGERGKPFLVTAHVWGT
jgi:hypothetical protein